MTGCEHSAAMMDCAAAPQIGAVERLENYARQTV
jgi:hypothetical protein